MGLLSEVLINKFWIEKVGKASIYLDFAFCRFFTCVTYGEAQLYLSNINWPFNVNRLVSFFLQNKIRGYDAFCLHFWSSLKGESEKKGRISQLFLLKETSLPSSSRFQRYYWTESLSCSKKRKSGSGDIPIK